MSRRPPPEGMMNLLSPEQRAKIEHVASDFLKSPEELAEAMRKAGVEKVDCECSSCTLVPFVSRASLSRVGEVIEQSEDVCSVPLWKFPRFTSLRVSL